MGACLALGSLASCVSKHLPVVVSLYNKCTLCNFNIFVANLAARCLAKKTLRYDIDATSSETNDTS